MQSVTVIPRERSSTLEQELWASGLVFFPTGHLHVPCSGLPGTRVSVVRSPVSVPLVSQAMMGPGDHR